MPASPLSVRLPAQTYESLCTLAKEKQRSVHWLMLDAVQKYAEAESKKAAFRQATLAAWEEYAESGLHATASEVSEWLRSVGGDHETAAPACHR